MNKTVKIVLASPKPIEAATTKDSGAVQVGGAAIRFASTKDAGVAHVGGAAIRF